ncbi:hypothetical protein ACFOEE_08510 [Pseudoalteromonas fenneropenaei]|uniref:Uncharacterized protein n=1 Tax=Pseudoalteromonas fenneropenaei TaxID=1737459 RepID=A0ABV7CJ70_9GAMM
MNTFKRLFDRYKYWLNAFLLVLPAWYFYQTLNPKFPEALTAQTIGEFTIVPMPLDERAPYRHDGLYVKDFLFMFNQGEVDNIRQAYVNIGAQALSLNEFRSYELGILHGTKHGQHVHALTSQTFNSEDKIWLTIETWNGEVLQTAWPLPTQFLES